MNDNDSSEVERRPIPPGQRGRPRIPKKLSLGPSLPPNYRWIRVLGRGGMGEVHLVEDTRLERKVALKTIIKEKVAAKNYAQRFLREARNLAKLSHPNVPTVYEFGQFEQAYYFTSRYIEGRSLDKVLEQGALDGERAIAIVEKVASALACAHEREILHRDVKPSNIMLDESDNPYLIDFGLARHFRDTQLTATGTAPGTAFYMAPEHRMGDPVAASDIYSLGAVLYETLTGRRVARASGKSSQRLLRVDETIARKEIDRALSRGAAAATRVCMKALAEKVEDRYRSCEEFQSILTELKTRIAARKESAMQDIPKPAPSTPPQNTATAKTDILGDPTESPGSRKKFTDNTLRVGEKGKVSMKGVDLVQGNDFEVEGEVNFDFDAPAESSPPLSRRRRPDPEEMIEICECKIAHLEQKLAMYAYGQEPVEFTIALEKAREELARWEDR